MTDAVAHHGEGPVWDERAGALLFVDLLRGDVLRYDGDVTRTHVATVAACVVPRTRGGHLVATERGFLVDGEDIEVWDDPSVRMNDGGCDPSGRFFCGSMAYDAAPGRGALYRLDLDRSVHVVLDSVTISNGIGWAPDGQSAYYVDSPTQRIDACTPDLSDRRPFVEIPSDAGSPDGLTVDAEGGVWVALWGGGALHRYAPDGALDVVVELPVRQPTSCAFGGEDLTTLFITTSAQDLVDPEPAAGALFAVEPGVCGLPTLEYAG